MKTKQWLNNARLTTWWLDFSDLGWPDSGLTAKWEQRARTFQEKGVNAVVLSGFHFRWDYHPLFERIFGTLGEITQICHQHELKVVERHSATRIHRVLDQKDRRRVHQKFHHQVPFYPDNWEDAAYRGEKLADWRQISARDERPVFVKEDCSHSFCPNHPGFQRSYQNYLERHLAAVPIDALLSEDLNFRPDIHSCSCSHCRERFLKEAGVKLPPIGDRNFWGNRDNPEFLAWLGARYRWQADHFQRLRAFLPKEIVLASSASSCISPGLAQVGSSPQLFSEPLDFILHEIPPDRRLQADESEIIAELAGFASLARSQKKPLVVLCHVEHPGEVSAWLHFLAEHQCRPWIAKQVKRAKTIPEEQLLEGGYTFEKTKKKGAAESVQAIAFSEAFRDRLDPDEAENYVETYRQLSTDLLSRGTEPYLLFDNMWSQISPEQWECLWVLDSRSLTDEQTRIVETWQDKGLAVGTS